MTSQQLDIDKLAREKVQEIEEQLVAAENCKPNNINVWLSVLKQIITAADLHRTNDNKSKEEHNSANDSSKTETSESIYADYADDNEQFHAADLTEQFASNSVKWTIRVHAFKIVHRLVNMLSNRSTALKHLPDLVRLSFVAATSPYDDLKMQGFEMFKFLINKFASVEEKEFPGHSILEQYRTQVLSALKPAFELDSPPYITAIASQVCCLWICRGLEKDPSDVKKTLQLLMMTVEKLENQSVNQNSKLYTESELEQERLDILGAWAQLYIRTTESSHIPSNSKLDITSDLHELVIAQINTLVLRWWEALKDYALLIMPASKVALGSHGSEHVYTREVALKLFEPIWPKLVLASSMWLCSNEFNLCDSNNRMKKISKTQYFKFICGILMKELCTCHSNRGTGTKDSLPDSTASAIRSLTTLIGDHEMKSALTNDLAMLQEFYSILYSILINCTRAETPHHIMLRNLITLIFTLAIDGLNNNIENFRYGISYLSSSIKEEVALFSSDNVDEQIKTILFIRLYNITKTCKSMPRLERDDLQPLRDSLIGIMQVLKFNSYTEPIIKLLNICVALFEDKDDRQQLILKYLDMVLNGTGDLASNNNKELLHFRLRLVNELKRNYPNDFDAVLGDEMKTILASMEKCLSDSKIQTEARIKDAAKKSAQAASSGAIKPKAKIVLKADFSNFYTK